MGVSSQRHALAALYPQGKDPQYPLDRRLGGPQSRSGHRGYKKNPLPLLGIKPRSSSPQSDTIMIELPRLLIIIKLRSKHACMKILNKIRLETFKIVTKIQTYLNLFVGNNRKGQHIMRFKRILREVEE
jgi:hypothetical protein